MHSRFAPLADDTALPTVEKSDNVDYLGHARGDQLLATPVCGTRDVSRAR